jgi:hypothetical protein
MLKRRSLIGIIVFGVLFLYYPLGVLGGPFDMIKTKGGDKAGGSVSRGDIDNIYRLVTEADGLLLKSLKFASRMLLNKEENDEFESKQKAAESKSDPKEREAEQRQVIADQTRRLQEELEKQETAQKTESLSSEQKVLFGKAIYNVILAGLKDKDAVDQSQKLLQKIQGNPMAATSFLSDIPKIKDIVTTLPAQVVKTVSLGSNLTKLAQKSKIEVTIPKSASEAPEEVDL